MALQVHRGEILHLLGDPAKDGKDAIVHFEDGLMLVENGYIANIGPADQLMHKLPKHCEIRVHGNGLMVPGFIDCHVHYPQCEIIAAYGTQLLQWLETHTFPAESSFSDPVHANNIAQFFIDELIRNGTTTALVFATVHPESVDAFFQQAEAKNMRMISGKVMMDRHAPDYLLDTPESSYQDSLALIKRWHNKGRLGYAVTPRFAPTSSSAQLHAAGRLLTEFPDLHLHTHISENKDECKWVDELFPQCNGYLDVYDHHGLLGRRSVFAHGIHLSPNEWQRMATTASNIAHCPLSNLFIGSGLFDYQSAQQYGVGVGLGTDVGGGDSFSILRTVNEAYKVQQLQGNNLSPFQSFYLSTLGGAKALDLHHHIGNFEVGKEADFVVLDYAATPLLQLRINSCKDLSQKLFVLQMLGDDRAIKETWVMGRQLKPSL